MPPESRKKLYDAVSTKFDIGSFDEFNKKMDDAASRKKFYDSVSNDFDLGDFNTFEGKISLKKKAQSVASATGGFGSQLGSQTFQPTKAYVPAPLVGTGVQDFQKQEAQRQAAAEKLSNKLKGQQAAYYAGQGEQGFVDVENAKIQSDYNQLQAVIQKDLGNKGNRATYTYNKLLEGTGSMISGGIDAGLNALRYAQPMSPFVTDATILDYRTNIAPEVKGFLKDAIGADVDKGSERRYNEEFITGAIGGLAYSAPAMVTPFGIGLYSQAYDSGLDLINSTTAGQGLTEAEKTLFAGTLGAVMGRLEKIGLDRTLGRTLSSELANGLAFKAINELSKKGGAKITSKAIGDFAEASLRKTKNRLLNSADQGYRAFLDEFTTGGLQEVATIGAEQAVNKLKNKDIFDTQDMGEMFGRVLKSAAAEGVGGAILGTAKGGLLVNTKNHITDKISKAKSFDDVRNLLLDVEKIGQENNYSPEEVQGVVDTVNDIVQKRQKLPQDLTPAQTTGIVSLMIDRDELTDNLKELEVELNNTDDALKPVKAGEVELVKKQIAAINARIAEISQNPDYAVQEPSTTSQVPSVIEGGQNIQEGGEGVGQGVEGTQAPQEAPIQEPTAEISPEEEVAILREQEQQELAEAIPNIEDYKVDGNIDKGLITNRKDLRKYNKIYAKYDKLITPLLAEAPAQAAPAQDAGVSATNKSQLNDLKSRVTDSVKSAVIQTAERAINTLKSILPEFDIVIHENEDSYNDSVVSVGGQTNTRGNFYASKNADGTYSGRIDINLNKANARTVAHEVAHAVLLKSFGENPKLFKTFRDKISKVLNSSRNAELIRFSNLYEGDVQSEEYLTELTAILEQQQDKLSPTVLQQVAAIINDLVSKLTNGAIKPFENVKDTKDIIDFFNTVSGAIREGSKIDVDGVSGKINSDAPPLKDVSNKVINKATLIQDLGLDRFPEMKNRIFTGFSLKKLGNVKAHLTFSDRLVTGVVDGIDYLGGVLFAAATNRVWASFTEKRVKSIIKGMTINSDGYRYLMPALLSGEAHMSNKDMVNTSLKLVEKSILNGNISPIEADARIKKLLNRKPLEKFKSIYANEIGNNELTKEVVVDALDKTIVTSNSTFEQRKYFLESLLGKADINKKLRFGNLPSFGELANGLAEPITEGHEFGDIILVIRTKGELVAVQPKKGDSDYHPSYPWVIRSLNKDGSIADVETLLFDKSYNAVDVFPEVTNASGKKLKYEEYKKVYGEQAKSRYLNYMGAGPMSTNVSETVLSEAEQKQPVSKSQKIDEELSKSSGTTQVATTTGSYVKAAEILKKLNIKGKVLDYGAGLGLGTDAMSKVLGKDVDSYEINAERWKGNKPVTYTKSEDIDGKFNGIVSLNVLNVVPKDIRDFILQDIYNHLENGGKAVISSRKFKGDIDGAKNFELGPEDKSYIIKRQKDGKLVDVYQKGFDGDELVDYVKEVLGNKVDVKKDNSFGATGVVIEKLPVSKSQKVEGEEKAPQKGGPLARIKQAIEKSRKAKSGVGPVSQPVEFEEAEVIPSEKGKEFLFNTLGAPARNIEKQKQLSQGAGSFFNKVKRAAIDTKYDIAKALTKSKTPIGDVARAAMRNAKGYTGASSLVIKLVNSQIFDKLSFAPNIKIKVSDKGKIVETIRSERQLFDAFLDANRIINIDARIRDKFSELVSLSRELKNGIKNESLTKEEQDELVNQISQLKEYLGRRKALDIKGPTGQLQMIGYQDPDFVYTDKLIDLLKEDYAPIQYTHTNGATMKDAEQGLAEMKEQLPDLYETFDKMSSVYYDTFRDLLEESLKNGLITKEVYDELWSYNYIPTKFIQHFIEGELAIDNPSKSKKLSASLKNLTGGSEEDVITNYQYILELYAHATYRRIFDNRAAVKLAQAIGKIDPNKFGKDSQFFIQKPNGKDKKGNPTYSDPEKGYDYIKFMVDGVENRIIAPKQFVDIWYDSEFQSSPWLDSTVNFLSKLSLVEFIKGVFTKYSPVFGVTQILLDAPQALISTKAYPDFFLGSVLLAKDYATVAKDVMSIVRDGKPTKFFVEAVQAGVFSDFLSTENDLIRGEKFTNYDGTDNIKNKIKYLASRINRGVDKTLESIAKVNEAVEYSTRLAVYYRMKQNLISKFKKDNNGAEPTGQDLENIQLLSAEQSRNVVDFSVGGGVTKQANRLFAYLNSTIQVFVSAARGLKNNPWKAGLMMMEIGAAGAALLAYSLGDLGGEDDEEKKKRYKEYRKRSTYEKESYFLMWTGDPERPFLRIPKPPLFKGLINLFEQAYLNASRGEEFNQEKMWSAFQRDIPFGNPLAELTRNPMINAAFKYFNNYDQFRKENIVKDEEKILDFAETKGATQLYKNIGKASKNLGLKEGLSPKRLQEAVRSFTGDPSKNTWASLFDMGSKGAVALATGDTKELEENFSGNLYADIFKNSGLEGKLFAKKIDYDASFSEQLKEDEKEEYTKKYVIRADVNDIRNNSKDVRSAVKSIYEYLKPKVDSKDIDADYADRVMKQQFKLFGLKDAPEFYDDVAYAKDNDTKAKILNYYLSDMSNAEAGKVMKDMVSKGLLSEEAFLKTINLRAGKK